MRSTYFGPPPSYLLTYLLTYSVCDNLKARDASASKNIRRNTGNQIQKLPHWLCSGQPLLLAEERRKWMCGKPPALLLM